jgi:hypothetical protein
MHVFCDDICALVKIDTQNGAAERLHRQPATFNVEVDVAAVTPAVDERLRCPGHVAAEIADVVW